jgi:hypothetical protein
VDIELSALGLDPSRPLRRLPPRPPQMRQPGYEDEFESLIVFYDCFASFDDRFCIMIGPPLANLKPAVMPAIRTAFRRRLWGRPLARNGDRHSSVFVRSRKQSVPLNTGLFAQEQIVVQPNGCDIFRGKHVLLTTSKDNPLPWIRDWVTFYVAHHGCNAVLIYDNGSTGYSIEDVQRTLSLVNGLDVALVVNWPYKFGPRGGPFGPWDSDYCQYGMLEHARHRFLLHAAAVVNSDVDELIITRNAQSVFDLARQSATGYLRFGGLWVENATTADDENRRHMHYFYQSRAPQREINHKWAVVPSRCPAGSQWCVHLIRGMDSDAALSACVSLRHFKAINTNWKMPRWIPESPNEHDHVLDEELLPWLKVFESGAAT